MNIRKKLWLSQAEKKAINSYFEITAKSVSVIAKNERANTQELELQKTLINDLYLEINNLKEQLNILLNNNKKTTKTTTTKSGTTTKTKKTTTTNANAKNEKECK